MLRVKAFIASLALLGMLLHAGLVVRHSTMTFDTLLSDAGSFGIGVMCHRPDDLPQSTDEGAPTQDGSAASCPLCLTAGAIVAVLPPDFSVGVPTDARSARQEIIAEIAAPRLGPVCPPARGPPLFV